MRLREKLDLQAGDEVIIEDENGNEFKEYIKEVIYIADFPVTGKFITTHDFHIIEEKLGSEYVYKVSGKYQIKEVWRFYNERLHRFDNIDKIEKSYSKIYPIEPKRISHSKMEYQDINDKKISEEEAIELYKKIKNDLKFVSLNVEVDHKKDIIIIDGDNLEIMIKKDKILYVTSRKKPLEGKWNYWIRLINGEEIEISKKEYTQLKEEL